MFFIIAQSLSPLSEYVNKAFPFVFKRVIRLAPIMPYMEIYDSDSYSITILGEYSTQEEVDALV